MIGDYPVDWTDPHVRPLLGVLESVYRMEDIESIVSKAGLRMGDVAVSARSALTWRSVYDLAAGNLAVDALLEEDRVGWARWPTSLASAAPATVDWNEILRKPRGESGSAISEVLRTFGPYAGRLAEAVAGDYQHESDAALLGSDLGPELAHLKY